MTKDQMEHGETLGRIDRERALQAAWIRFAAGALAGLNGAIAHTEDAAMAADDMLTELTKRDARGDFTDEAN